MNLRKTQNFITMKRLISNGLLMTLLLFVGLSSCKKDPVIVKVAGIILDQKTAIVRIGTPFKLTASISPFDATDKTVTWSTKDASIATVAADGDWAAAFLAQNFGGQPAA